MDPDQIAAFIQAQVAAALQAQAPLPPPNRPRPAKPDTFDAATPSADVELWLFSLDEYLEACNVTNDDQKIREAATFLRGPALTWWRTVKQGPPESRVVTWDAFKQNIRLAFKPINSIKVARDRLAALRQTTSVRAYATAFRNVTLDIPSMTDEEKLDRFMRGLKRKTREQVELKEPATFKVRLAERFDTLAWRYHDTAWPATPTDTDGPAAMELGAIQAAPPSTPIKLNPELKRILIQEGRCFYCRETGHTVATCPKRSKQGHLATVSAVHPMAARRTGTPIGHLAAINYYQPPSAEAHDNRRTAQAAYDDDMAV